MSLIRWIHKRSIVTKAINETTLCLKKVLSFLFVTYPPSSLNSTKIGHMVGSECRLKTHVSNPGYPLSYKSESKHHLFSTTSQLNGDFNGLYLRKGT